MSSRLNGVKRNAKWRKTRAKGKSRYVLKFALLLSSVNFVGALLYRLIRPNESPPHIPLEAWHFAGFQALIGLITGLVVGAWMWRTNEQEYASTLEGEDEGGGTDSRP